jgi:hypothetical protein
VIQTLPFEPSTPSYRVSTTLGDTQYLLDVHWNERAEAWYFDILAADETRIRSGIKVVLGTFLGGRCVTPGFPDGVLVATDTSGEGRDAGFDDLGTRVVVLFIPYEGSPP